jgi:hypothetical protein
MFYGSCLFTMAFAFPMFVCHSMVNRALRRDTGDRLKGSGSAGQALRLATLTLVEGGVMKSKPYRRRSPTATAGNQGSRTRKFIRQACRTAAATPKEDDPIYLAIEEHRKAGQERYEIGRKPGRTNHDLDDALANELDASRRLFNTAPATHDGMVALFRHVKRRCLATTQP